MRGSLAAVFHHRVIIGGRKEITGSRRIEFAQTRRKRRTKKKKYKEIQQARTTNYQNKKKLGYTLL
jgi:hypothetical protein